MTTWPSRSRWWIAAVLASSAASLTGCGESNPTISTQGATVAVHRSTTGSENLYYAASRTILALEYPSLKKIAQLDGFDGDAEALCADSHGDVFAAIRIRLGSKNKVVEYAPGSTKPIATLVTISEPLSCSVDPKTGNLAVAVEKDESGPEGIEVFPHATGTYQLYFDSDISASGCGYDAKGNLYMSGGEATGKEGIAELPYGHKTFVTATTPDQIGDSTFEMRDMVFDGKYMTVGTVGATYGARTYYIYRFQVVNNVVKIRGTVAAVMNGIDDQYGDETYFALNGNVAAITTDLGRVVSYSYPAGGDQIGVSKNQYGHDNGDPIVFARAGSSI